MKLERRRQGDVTILSFVGELDRFSFSAIARETESMIEAGEIRMVYNLRQLTIAQSLNLILIRDLKRCRVLGGDLVVTQPNGFLRKAFSAVGLDKVWNIYDTDEEGVQHFLRVREDGGSVGKGDGT